MRSDNQRTWSCAARCECTLSHIYRLAVFLVVVGLVLLLLLLGYDATAALATATGTVTLACAAAARLIDRADASSTANALGWRADRCLLP